MRTHSERRGVDGARGRRGPVLLGAAALLGASGGRGRLALGRNARRRPAPAVTGCAAVRRPVQAPATLSAEAARAVRRRRWPTVAAAPRRPSKWPTPAPSSRPATGRRVRRRRRRAGELGRRLFFDPGASHSKRVSCASCHQPEHGFSDPRGAQRRRLRPDAAPQPAVLDLGLQRRRSTGTASSRPSRTSSPRARATRAPPTGGYTARRTARRVRKVTPVAESLAKAGLYAERVRGRVRRRDPTRERVSDGRRGVRAHAAEHDEPLRPLPDGDAGALTPEAARGFELFRGRAGCAQCHTARGPRPALTDERFHNTGLAERARRTPAGARLAAAAPFARRTEARRLESTSRTRAPSRRRRCATSRCARPTCTTAPSPRSTPVVRYYAVECGTDRRHAPRPARRPSPRAEPPAEVDRDVADLVAFLVALTGERARASPRRRGRSAPTHAPAVPRREGRALRAVVALAPGGDVAPRAHSRSRRRRST